MTFLSDLFKSNEEKLAEEIQEAHTQGQRDGHKGVYDEPYNPIQTLCATSQSHAERMEAANKGYAEGFVHAESQDEEKNSCFLTMACTQAVGLSDDCHELTTLRRFRDTFVRGLGNGKSLIQEYYAVSPQIVPRLSDEELQVIYEKVQNIVSQIEHEEFQAAFDAYAEMFIGLKRKHLEPA